MSKRMFFVLTNAQQTETLAPMDHLKNITKFRFNHVSYTSASNQKVMIIYVKDFTGIRYSDDSLFTHITAAYRLLGATTTLQYNGLQNSWHCINKTPLTVYKIDFEIRLDKDLSSDISASNPVYVEIEFE